jgi:hypothetical protein
MEKGQEIMRLEYELKIRLIELTTYKTQLVKAQGTLSLRAVWECYERERSGGLKFKTRADRWQHFLNTKGSSLGACFSQTPEPKRATKLTNLYGKLSDFVHSPELDKVIIHKSKFDDEEICVLQSLLKDLRVQYEVWDLGSMIESFP